MLDWYAVHARPLPWRMTTDPWAVLVSEVMLQQTPVARVVPVYTEWLARWPAPADLAASPAGDAVRAWGRLGYPRRAVRLHAAAGVITTSYAGAVPSALSALLTLPGVGDYTARAVASFAFGQRHPVVDTNVRRVVARAVDGVERAGPPRAVADLAAVARFVPESPAAAATFGVALMELGALVCTARSPSCSVCPLAAGCAWLLAGRPAYGGPVVRKPQWQGSDRQARGALLAQLRGAAGSVGASELAAAWPDRAQRLRALESLVTDGLAEAVGGGGYGLAGYEQVCPSGSRPSALL
ncbi:MAG: A/G-specific adenine glycosylase [Frankiaceae bacterium]|nr:A/G-specific adenine glycosylase [Frankiaceae bacterium]